MGGLWLVMLWVVGFVSNIFGVVCTGSELIVGFIFSPCKFNWCCVLVVFLCLFGVYVGGWTGFSCLWV